MAWCKLSVITAGTALLVMASNRIDASPGVGETERQPQTSRGVVLPVWETGEMGGDFDVRIWPEDMVLWLERENLRRIIKDPKVPKEEREQLKQLLARQLAWSRRWVDE